MSLFFFVGRLPIYTGLQHLVIFPSAPYGMPLELPTLPQKLKEQGYNTHLVGMYMYIIPITTPH